MRRRLDGLLQGDHAGVRLGPGSDAEELARYTPGHDVRRIDWKVTARARDPHVWLTRAEHELDTWLLLDQTPSMAFGTAATEKADLATTVAGAVGLLTDAPGNRLGLAVLDTYGLTWARPLAGRVAAHRAVRQTAGAPGRRRRAQPGRGDHAAGATAPPVRACGSSCPTCWTRPARSSGRFDWEAPLRRLAARHDVVVVEVLDPRELELPPVGHLVLVDPESGRQREIGTDLRRPHRLCRGRHRLPERHRPGRAGRRGGTRPAAHRPRLGRRSGPLRSRASPTAGPPRTRSTRRHR